MSGIAALYVENCACSKKSSQTGFRLFQHLSL